jgi:hypothetical protein
MNYNNNNLNPTSGYWNLSLNSANADEPKYRGPFTDLSYCTTKHLKPMIDNKQKIDASFSSLKTKYSDFGTFMKQFSDKPGFADFNSLNPSDFCTSFLQTTDITTGVVTNDPFYEECDTKATALNKMVKDMSNNIARQNVRFANLKADEMCPNVDYGVLQKQYQEMVQRRQEIDVIMNEYNKKNANSLTQAHLQETDMLLYTSVIWIVLGTSALYFSFRYLND